MKRLLIIFIFLLIFTIMGFAELSDEVLELVEDLRFKHYNVRYGASGTLICVDDSYIIKLEPEEIEIIDFEIEGVQLKVGWEVWINDKCYYVVLVEKEDDDE